jgi:hypothetical protein
MPASNLLSSPGQLRSPASAALIALAAAAEAALAAEAAPVSVGGVMLPR